MTRLGYRLAYFVRTALRSLRASPVPALVAVGTIAVTLLMVGIFSLLLKQMQGLVERLGDELRVTAYLEAKLSDAEMRELAAGVRTVEGVEQVELVSAAEALARFERGVGSQSGLLDGLETNPLPASLEIVLVPDRRTPEGIRVVVESLDGLPGIQELGYGQEWVEGYSRALGLVRSLAWALGCVFGIAALLIVANTIRLAVYARRDELEILSLVGASRSFVRAPFLLEGALEGAAGALLALALLGLVFVWVLPGVDLGIELLIGYSRPEFFSWGEAGLLVVAGAGLGLLGSAAALVSGWEA